MAKKVVLRSPDKDKFKTWLNVIVDSLHSFTTIHTKNGFTFFTIDDTREQIKFSAQHTDIYFKSGWYIQVYN